MSITTGTSRGDFRLKPGSPALALGFKPFDGSKAGVYGDAAWIAKARNVTYPPFEVPPELPAVAVALTFERDEPGRPPRSFDITLGNKGDSILVTEETAATGKRSVKVTHAPNLKSNWMPLLVYPTHFKQGVLSNSFDLRIEKASMINYEWCGFSSTADTATSYYLDNFTLQQEGAAQNHGKKP